ncbi:hypothetical protein CLV30_11499 [Haloactinopolyspora alba]|uniref:TrbL/VirB6 plasmid conjugal transfer protein n=1 Tax=Haloactinopolyspora alba TaxID=648780 RepID=A0A2P8DVX5_9ACTN|nr:hypothetical protein [Haloactinopolyspora alba]PSL01369.1 hypothetical protein CLV30_11499 [Haloactinopolyspora alba]
MSLSALATGAGHLAGVATDANFDNLVYSHDPADGSPLNVPASAIKLALNGGGLTELGTVFFKFIMEMLWAAYQACMRMIAWFANFAMEMTWLETIRGPFEAIEDVLQDILRSYNLYATMLVITAFICIIWMARGRWGQGILELFVALVIANYAIASVGSTETDTTPVVTTSPIELMIGGGGHDGLVYESRDFGTSVVGQLDNEIESHGEDEGYVAMSPGQSIVKSFLWYPVQLVNFGEVLSHECQTAYALVLRALGNGKGEGDGDELASVLRDRVPGDKGERAADAVGDDVKYDSEAWAVPGACEHEDEEYYKDQANIDGVITQWFLGPSVGLLALVILVMAGAVVLAGINAVVQCFKLLLALLVAILPRGGRRSLWVTIGSAATSLLIVVFTIIFLGTFLAVVQQILNVGENTPVGEVIGTFLLVDILLVVGLIIFWRGRKSVAQSNEKMADAMGKATASGGGGGGGFAKGANGSGLGRFHTAMDVQRDLTGGRHMHDVMGRRRGGYFRGPGSMTMSGNGGGGFGSGAGAAGGDGGPGGRPGGGTGSRTGRAAGAVMRSGAARGARKVVAGAALGAATGGSSLLVQAPAAAVRGGAVLSKSRAFRSGAKMVSANAGRGARWAGNRGSYAFHRARNDWDRASRAQQTNRRRGLAAQRRRDAASMSRYDMGTRGADVAARATNGRFGTALWAQNRRASRSAKVDEKDKKFMEKRAEHFAADDADWSKMTPEQQSRNVDWLWAKSKRELKRMDRKRARRKGGFG